MMPKGTKNTSPKCGECPLAEGCDAFNTRRVEKLPVKIPKKKPVDRWMYFYIIHDQKNIILVKRSDNDIWKSLYQFPVAESAGSITKKEMVGSLFIEVMSHLKGTPDPTIKFHHFSEPILHQLTHRTIHAHFIHVEMTPLPSSLPDGTIAIPMDHLEKYAVPRLIERYMESAKFSYL
jgi:A/G-specific adenine glycosylase